MFSSTIIATIARPTLSRAVCSVLDQILDTDDFEVIVVNDTGQPLPEENWQYSYMAKLWMKTGRATLSDIVLTWKVPKYL